MHPLNWNRVANWDIENTRFQIRGFLYKQNTYEQSDRALN